MILHSNGLAYGTVRRAPAPGFAHAILLDQGRRSETWYVIDLYGGMEVLTDDEVADWPIVYTPVDDEAWAADLDAREAQAREAVEQ